MIVPRFQSMDLVYEIISIKIVFDGNRRIWIGVASPPHNQEQNANEASYCKQV